MHNPYKGATALSLIRPQFLYLFVSAPAGVGPGRKAAIVSESYHKAANRDILRAMILDARSFNEECGFPRSPVVVIGGGTVGLFLAIHLTRAGISTIVLEAGGQVADTGRPGRTAVSLGKPHAGVATGRAFGLGGTSVLWAGQLAEFDEADLVAPGKEWPLTYSELKRWYRHVYTFLNIEPLQLGDDDLAIDDKPEDGIERFVTSWLPQPNFPARFRADLSSNPLLTVILNATVNEIIFEGTTAIAVVVRGSQGLKFRISGRQFVFACGTIETSRFFLSAQRSLPVPWKYNANIGTYFQDHPVGRVANVRVLNETKFRNYFENGIKRGLKFQPKLRNVSGFARPAFSGVVGSFTFLSRLQHSFDDLKMLIKTFTSGLSFAKLGTLAADVCLLGHALVPVTVRYVRHRRIMVFLDQGTEFIVQSEQIPTSSSVIRLMKDTLQQDGLFRAEVHWNLDGRELNNILDFTTRADQYLRRKQIATLQIDQRLLRGDPSIFSQFGDFYHQAGGMCIGNSASSGVVDSDCRVWGTANIFIAGASVFPTSSHANITLTALALAARLADTLERSERLK
jgi:hypothetical protein